jgi:hypothetical protein
MDMVEDMEEEKEEEEVMEQAEENLIKPEFQTIFRKAIFAVFPPLLTSGDRECLFSVWAKIWG